MNHLLAQRAPIALLLFSLAGCSPAAPVTTTPSSAATEPSATAPTTTPSSPTASTIDTTNWSSYTSARHGVSLKHPPGWKVFRANRGWTLAADANRPESTGQDGFMSPGGDVYVTVWSTPAKDTPETLEGVAAWVEQYCEKGGQPCPGIRDRAVPLCNERWDCHPGLLVPFAGDESHAFFTGGNHRARMVGLAVWRPETHESVAKYGGARRLLEGFLSTMDVCPARPGETPAGCSR